jgi:tRNA(Leu) C34 or U34 (ribose-2'-O)-methylase TrmL
MGADSIFPTAKAKRTALDYECRCFKYKSWEEFLTMMDQFPLHKLIGITPHSNIMIQNIVPSKNHKDVLVFGRESDGFDDEAHGTLDLLVALPMAPGQRSFNITVSVAMAINHWIN